MSPAQDAVSPAQDAVSPAQDDVSSTGDNADTAKPKATSRRKGKSKAKVKKADAASTDSAHDHDAAHAAFIAQFPTTDPDDVAANATPVSDVISETDDSEKAQDPAPVDVSADDETETDTETAASETAEVSEARNEFEADAAADAGDGEAEKESAGNDVTEHAAAAVGVTGSEDTEAAEADAASEAAAATPEVENAEGTEASDAATPPDAEADTGGVPEADAEVVSDETATPATPEPAVAAAALDPDVDGTDDPDEALLDDDDDVSSWVRPYVWTGGRTETSMDFAIETLVSAREQVAGTEEAIRDEHRRVLELCEQPRSVTEIAALLSVPLGVAKTLLGAMVEDDLVVVHRTNGSAAGPDLALMERVLRGLKKL